MTKTFIKQFNTYDRTIFWILLSIGIFALTIYVYLLSSSVIAVIARKEAEIEIGRSGTRVAELESTYAHIDRRIDLAVAHENGFIDVSDARYISRAEAGTFSLRARNDEVHE